MTAGLGSGRVGAALAVSVCAWVGISSLATGASVSGPLLLVVPAVAAYVVGRLVGPWRTPAAALLAVVVLATLVIGADRVPRHRPGAQVLETDVFGYLNADAAWAVQGLAAAALVVVGTRRTGPRVLGVVLMGGLGLQPLLTGSWAAVLGGVLVAGVLLGVPGRRVAAAGLAATVAGVGLTAVLAVAHDADPDLTDPAARVLTERRLDLWSDAVDLAAEHPVTGVGSGRFEEESATARASRDTKPAHSTWLEAAAETGVPGALLLLALALWPLAAVGTGRAAAVGAAAWTALCLHASIDYVTDTVGVVVLAALVVGLASGSDTGKRPSATWRGFPELVDPS